MTKISRVFTCTVTTGALGFANVKLVKTGGSFPKDEAVVIHRGTQLGSGAVLTTVCSTAFDHGNTANFPINAPSGNPSSWNCNAVATQGACPAVPKPK